MLLVFVLNEVLVGAYIVIVFAYSMFCAEFRKSEHLEELEGKGFGLDEDEVLKVKKELQESRVKSESLMKEKGLAKV